MPEQPHPNDTNRIELPPTATVTPQTGNGDDAHAPLRLTPYQQRKRKSPFYKLLECVYDAVLITTPDGTIVECNERACDFFILSAEHLLGKPVISLISGASPILLETILNNVEDKRYTLVDAKCKRADGSSFDAEIAVNRMSLNAHVRLVFFIRDITIRKQAQLQLTHAVERLQAHDRARMEFVSNVSHELRTPLTSMIYAVGNMQRGVVGPLSEKAMHYLERLDSDCHRMLATVNDILDLRQVENNTLVLTPSLSSLSCIVEAAIDTLQVQSDAKRQQVLRDFGTKELFARCDVQKMERVMLNIIGNAIKFTPSNGTISLAIAEAPDNPHFALLTCRDTGMGIPADKLPHISERYFRVGNFVKGTGLGLAITREIVELHQGKIQFASPVPGTDKGTEVCVRLPLVPAPTIVLGSPDETIRQQLEKSGYEVATVDAPKHLLETYLANKAKAVVLFRNETSGYRETILQIRDDAKTKRMPILVLGKEELSYREATLFRQLAIVYCRSDQVSDTLPHCLAQAIGGRAAKGGNDE